MDELAKLDLCAQAALVKAGQVTAEELLEGAIRRSEKTNSQLNAIIRPLHEEARREARGADKSSVFAGAPFLVKDLYCHMAGVPTTGASEITRDFVPDHDSELMRRYRKAGLSTFGKTNLCEFGTLGTTEPKLFGVTRNPWDILRSSGGSSGGAGAAVAAGIVPAAHGGDGAGSIRIPASCCGLFGLKPSRGRITLGPDQGDSTGGIVNEHVLSVSVRDSAALLDATRGTLAGDPYTAPTPELSYIDALRSKPGRLRIAVTTTSLLDTYVDPECAKATIDTARLCESLGHEVVEASPLLDGDTYRIYYKRFWAMTATRAITALARSRNVRPESLASGVEPFNQYLYSVGSKVTAADYLVDLNWFHGVGRTIANFLGDFDLWLTPTLGSPPPLLGHFDADIHGGEEVMERFLQFLSFTTFANMAGLPSMSVPMYWTPAGLPIGTQFTGRFNDEETLFQLAAQLEEARPWSVRRPPVHATA
ncbi:amidase [Phyllobacterium sp. 0TCS1.6C]|uniref:amidase n=1 Tax=unclassified Phyllobacterium TaxID=2638441 RepID=UPI0022652066|nr:MULTISPECIES: amidase [unclassified Phyllobacterium]MCX8279079.1 amidase [Phyllobacterium sp. 0TCS1.6C]MCX8293863.1 amidase [Phyllobacterium sp. 0TCS1.6A]